MDNNELEDFLKVRFAPLRETDQAASTAQRSIAPQVMQRIEDLPGWTRESPRRGWVLGFAMLVGALVCLPSLQGLRLSLVVQQVNTAGEWLAGQLGTLPLGSVLGSSSHFDASVWFGLGALFLVLPLMFLLLEE